ncbi:NAD(P)-dependent oxidoreductase [soil metagenome]
MNAATTPRAGVIGLGELGAPVARRLASTGVSVSMHDARPGRAEELSALHDRLTAGDHLSAFSAPVVFCLLPNTEITSAAIQGALGQGGIAAGALVIDMCSADPSRAEDTSSRLAAVGAHYLAATVLSGGGSEAEAGELALAVGGPRASLPQARAWLARISTTVLEFDSARQAQTMKLVNNFVSLAASALEAEAVAVAGAAGIAADRVFAALDAGSARNWMNLTHARRIEALPASEGPAGFRAELAEKDLRYLVSMAMTTGVPVPVATATQQTYARARFSGMGDTEAGTWPWRMMRMRANGAS